MPSKAAGVGRNTHYDWLKADDDYSAAIDDAKEEAADHLELEARRRAMDGLMRIRHCKGQVVMVPKDMNNPDGDQIPLVEHEYSDLLLIFLLKSLRPEKFRDNVNMTGRVDHTHQVMQNRDKLDAQYKVLTDRMDRSARSLGDN